MQDNLQSAIAKILGQKNETTNEANFNNASTNAKLNYLNSKIDNLETNVEVSGVPHLEEIGVFAPEQVYSIYGNGYVLVSGSNLNVAQLQVNGKQASAGVFSVSDSTFKIPFTQSFYVYNCSTYPLKYAYYKY